MRRKLTAVLAPVLLVALAACGGGDDPLADDSGGDSGGDDSTVTIGSANFPENELLAEMYAQALEAEGITVERQFNIGARELYLKALEDGSIDMLPEYNGALLAFQSPDGPPEGVTAPEDVYEAMLEVLPEGVIALEQSEAEDKDTLSVTSETATELGLATIDDLVPVAGELSVAAGPEFAERFQGLLGLEEVYGITFAEFVPLDAGGPLTLEALLSGEVDVANIFSTNSAIETEGLVVLEDTKNLYIAQNIVPILSESVSNDTIETALNAVSAALTTENLTAALAQVTVDKMSSADVAEQFLTDNGLI
jgi:osmoprotectant transport system substrate-binding protein